MSSENHSSSADVPSYTVEEIESATSEFIVKNAVRIFHRWRLPLESSLSAARDLSPGKLAEPPRPVALQ